MTKKFNFLLIDDNDIDNLVNSKLVERTGAAKQIIVKTSAKEALKHLRDSGGNFPDIILLDIHMPGKGGFEFLEEYQNLTNVPDGVIIYLVTSSQDNWDMEKAREKGFLTGVLNKPLSMEKIQEIL